MNRKRDIIIFFLLTVMGVICLCSCLSKPVRELRPFVWLTNSSQFILLQSENIEKPLDGLQLISASFGGQNYQVLTLVKADENGINMILLNEMGTSMGELVYNNDVLTFSSAVFPRSFRPEYIVADFQLCFYKADVLAEALRDAGLSFEQTDNTRRVLDGSTVIIEIVFAYNKIIFNNYLRGYMYALEGDFS